MGSFGPHQKNFDRIESHFEHQIAFVDTKLEVANLKRYVETEIVRVLLLL
jgi:hypothetical protein